MLATSDTAPEPRGAGWLIGRPPSSNARGAAGRSRIDRLTCRFGCP